MYHLQINYDTSLHPYNEHIYNISEPYAARVIYYNFKSMNKSPFLTRQITIKEDMFVITTFSGQDIKSKEIIGGQMTWLNNFKYLINLYNFIRSKQIYCDKFRPFIYTCPLCMEQNSVKKDRETDQAIVFKCKCGHEYHHVKKRRD